MTVENGFIIMNKYKVIGKKGEGTFSEVLKCQSIEDDTMWACKRLKRLYKSAETVNHLREVQALRRLTNHPNILELHELLYDDKTGAVVLVCELMTMNLYEFIKGRKQNLPEMTIKKYMFQLGRALEHMHRNGIFHRDVKPENILLKGDLLKLGDFGSCRSMRAKQPYTEYISTRWYRPPECLLTDGYYTQKMDMWSMGCVFYEITRLEPLCAGSSEVDQISKIHDVFGTPDDEILNKLQFKTRNINFNFPPKKGTGIERLIPFAPHDSVDLICKLCAYDADKRISAHQALKHVYFRELRKREMQRSNTTLQLHQSVSQQTSLVPSSGSNEIDNAVANDSDCNEIIHDININTKQVAPLNLQQRPDTRSKQPDDVINRLPTCNDTQRDIPWQIRSKQRPVGVDATSHVTSVLPFPSVAVAETKRVQHGAGGEVKKRTVYRFRMSSPCVANDALPPLEITNSNGAHQSIVLPLYLSTFRPRAYQYHQQHQHLKQHNITNQGSSKKPVAAAGLATHSHLSNADRRLCRR